MRKITFTLCLFIAFVDITNAQSFYSRRRDRLWMASYGVGFSTYHGDMHDVLYDGLSSALGGSLNGGIRRKFGSQLSLRLDLNYYQIGGDDAEGGANAIINRPGGRASGESDTRFVRNLNFRSRNLELSLLAVFNLIPVDGSYTRRPVVNPYLMFGIGRTTNRPKTYLPGDQGNYSVNLWEIQTEAAAPVSSYPKSVLVIPLGIGLRIKASRQIDILLEGARRFTFTDYLDDVATTYPSLDQVIEWNGGLGSETANIAAQIYDRSIEGGFEARKLGNTRGRENNDAYYIFSVRLEFYLPDNFLSELLSPSRRKPKFR
mgnify:FL=1